MATDVRYDVEVQDVEYQRLDGAPWLARVYQPKGPGPFPTIVEVHGGAWRNGDRTNNRGIAGDLASRGVLVASLDFRQPPLAAYPASVADVNLGIRWLKAHAGEFHGSARVGVMGNSSGGHLAVLNALRPRDARYAALPLPGGSDVDATVSYVLALWPVIDPLYRYQYAQRTGKQAHIEAHDAYWGTEEAMAEGNPQTAIDGEAEVELPPMLYLLKKDDKNHPLEMQERFIASYRKRGGEIEPVMFDGLPEHGMVPLADQPETIRAMEAMADFVRRHA